MGWESPQGSGLFRQLKQSTSGFCALPAPRAIRTLVPAGDAPLEGLQGTPLPNPNISFHLWTEDDQLCE